MSSQLCQTAYLVADNIQGGIGCFHSIQQKRSKLTIQVWFSTFFLILGAALTTRCIVVESCPNSLDATTRYSPASALVTFLITKDMLSSSSCRNLHRRDRSINMLNLDRSIRHINTHNSKLELNRKFVSSVLKDSRSQHQSPEMPLSGLPSLSKCFTKIAAQYI